jgi:hypothetical protein
MSNRRKHVFKVKGGYVVTSVDSFEHNIPEQVNQLYRHPSGFMAIYETVEECVEFCEAYKLHVKN